MKRIIYIALSSFFITACTSTDTKLKEAIHNYYQRVSLQSGAGSQNISEIEILSFEKDTAITVVTGYYSNKSLAQTESGNIKDTLKFYLVETHGELEVKGIAAY